MFACAEWENLSGINRNIVECKVKVLDMIQEAYVVLIETSWNVKLGEWNGEESDTRINRNIVECKDNKPQFTEPEHEGINRNIVECKDSFGTIRYLGGNVLIETSWNVKTFHK